MELKKFQIHISGINLEQNFGNYFNFSPTRYKLNILKMYIFIYVKKQ